MRAVRRFGRKTRRDAITANARVITADARDTSAARAARLHGVTVTSWDHRGVTVVTCIRAVSSSKRLASRWFSRIASSPACGNG